MFTTMICCQFMIVVCLTAMAVARDECASQTSCESCTSKNTFVRFLDVRCRWCPLDRKCHTFGSREIRYVAEDSNPCLSDMNIKQSSLCESTASSLQYDPNKAMMFAKLSAVAYAEPEYLTKCIKHILPDDDFEIVEAIGRKCEKWFDYKECFVYTAISHRHRTIVVGYRGTAGKLKQLTEEGLSRKSAHNDTVLFTNKGLVNNYFQLAFDRLYDPCIRQSVQKLANTYTTYDVVVTGHSLGGALASLTAYALVQKGGINKDRMKLYTFGMPRVGNKWYAFDHDKTVPHSWRIIHWRDVVARIPPITLGYYHHKTAVLYPKDMVGGSEYIVCTDNEDLACNKLLTASISQHTSYFEIDIGGYCKTNLKYKRNTDKPKFPEDRCEVISLKDAGEIINTEINNVTESICDFEKKDACDWTTSSGSTFSFKRNKGPSDSAGMTGPSSDSSNSGYYIYAEASGNEGQLTKLRSPNFFAGTYCLEFFYHMYGKDMGELKLVMHSTQTNKKTIFKASGDQGRNWKEVRRTINVANQKDIVIYFEFEAKIGKGHNSDIAIDKVRITQKKC